MKRQEPFNVLRDPNAWSSAPRAEAIAFSLFGSGFGTAAAFAASTAGQIAIAGVSLGLSVATNAIISALTPAPPTPKQSLLVNSRDAAAPQEFVYGEVRKGGPITYLETTRGGSVLYQIIPLAAHEIESVEAIYINDEVATLSPDGYDNGDRTGAGWVTSPRKWSEDDDADKHEIRIFYHLGDQTSITDTFANSSVESLDSVFFNTGATDEDSQNFGGVGQPTKASFVGNGIAYLFVRYGYAADVFRNGLPVITARIKGKKVFDPRTSTTAYSNNAALCIRDYLTSAYGLSDAQVDATVFSNAANVCDENVTLAAGGTEDRYTLNGVVRADQSYGDVLQQMVTSCAGTLFWGGGKWKLAVGAYNAPTKTLTLDDLRSNISLQTRVNLRDQFNKVQGVFNDANQRYIAADYPPIESASFLAQDNGVAQALDLDLPFTTSASTAQRLAKMALFRGREQMVFQAEFGMNAFDVEVGEIVALTIDRYGWTAKEFEVVNWRFFIGSEGDMRIAMALRETSAAAFSWTAEESEIISNDSTLDTPILGNRTNFRINLYNKEASETFTGAVPTGTFTYTFSTDTLSGGTLNGWTQAIPDLNPGENLFVITAFASSLSDTDEILATEFTSPVAIGRDGLDGGNLIVNGDFNGASENNWVFLAGGDGNDSRLNIDPANGGSLGYVVAERNTASVAPATATCPREGYVSFTATEVGSSLLPSWDILDAGVTASGAFQDKTGVTLLYAYPFLEYDGYIPVRPGQKFTFSCYHFDQRVTPNLTMNPYFGLNYYDADFNDITSNIPSAEFGDYWRPMSVEASDFGNQQWYKRSATFEIPPEAVGFEPVWVQPYLLVWSNIEFTFPVYFTGLEFKEAATTADIGPGEVVDTYSAEVATTYTLAANNTEEEILSVDIAVPNIGAGQGTGESFYLEAIVGGNIKHNAASTTGFTRLYVDDGTSGGKDRINSVETVGTGPAGISGFYSVAPGDYTVSVEGQTNDVANVVWRETTLMVKVVKR
jgi:hypothetical protein